MASLADSKAHFAARAKECGVPDAVLANLSASGVTTLGHLAFSLNRPGADFDETKFDDWLKTVNGGVAPTIGATAAARRLHFEAEVVLAASLKAAIESPSAESSTPKPLPYAEKNARMLQLKTSLPGLNLEGQHEPAQALMEECIHQYDTRTIRYIEPSKCNSREIEVMAGRSDRKLKIETNTLSVKETKSIPEEDTSTAFKLGACLKRRAVAYEFAGLISFRVHELYIDKLFKRLHTEPPPQYQATTLGQILRADREVWIHLAQTVNDIRPLADGTRPLDAALTNALNDYNVAFHLLPLPLSSLPSYNAQRSDSQSSFPPAPPTGHGPYTRPSGKGKKGKGKGKGVSLGSSYAPRGIKGCVGRDNRNRPLCFNFNLGKCEDAPVGASCAKGRHVCFKANCFKLHAFCVAHASEMPAAEAQQGG